MSPALVGKFFTTEPPGKHRSTYETLRGVKKRLGSHTQERFEWGRLKNNVVLS